jgi:hypothetical protein
VRCAIPHVFPLSPPPLPPVSPLAGAIARTEADVEALERDVTQRIKGLGLPGLDGLVQLFGAS